MAIRNDSSRIERNLDISEHNTKAEIRVALLMQWGEEESQAKYRYFVHTFADGSRLYLDRPARLNKGCDFIVYLENQLLWKNGNDRPPSHDDLWKELEAKQKQLSEPDWQSLCRAIVSVHSVQPYDISSSTRQAMDKLDGMSTEKIVRLCEWFFVEQDLTYWDGEGRDMLFNGLKKLPKFE